MIEIQPAFWCIMLLVGLISSCTSPYKGKPCVDVRKITWDCQDFCEKCTDQGITDPMNCKGGCWLMSEYAKPLYAEILTLGTCAEPDYTTRCCEALDAALAECVAENEAVITWDVEVGLFKFAHDLQERCFALYENR